MPDVKTLLAKFEKAYSRDLTRIEDDDPPRVPTGIFAFDLASGGGFPVGRISVVFGPEASMKSTLCLRALGEAQRLYPELIAVYVDVEGSFSKQWATKLGVDVSKLVVLAPDTAEQMVDTVEQMLYADDVSVIVVDSLAALTTAKELQSSAEDAMVGTAGLLINKFYRKATRALAVARAKADLKAAPTLICINQIRYKIGVLHGDPETMPGGPSFRYASSLTVRLYGKDEFDKELSTDLPAFKKVSVVMRKHKVPIIQKNAEFTVALLPNKKFQLAVGQSYDLATIMTYLKSLEMLRGKAGDYEVHFPTGEAVLGFKTQEAIKDRLVGDPEFSTAVRCAIIARVLQSESDVDD